MNQRRIVKDDGRYLIFYSFAAGGARFERAGTRGNEDVATRPPATPGKHVPDPETDGRV